ncbi:unnamed protein product [Periconia digitata]|uniref:Uncharacterized protein n=1 Tax=Periconia digitata TaxID=1303443 RepID=A0A9W4UHM6_9PLEO|nr:unnamed protein product [Periconia digitata]
MLLERDPTLAEAPGFTTEQLLELSRSVEAKQLQLEADINAYIKKKQHELALYQHELLAQYREMECTATPHHPTSTAAALSSSSSTPAPTSPQPDLPQHLSRAEEREKRTKHNRVHKREQELFGLVTPIFLPLLDARDVPQAKKKGEKSDASMGHDMPQSAPDLQMRSPSPRDADPPKERRSRVLEKGSKAELRESSSGGDTSAAEKRSRSDSAKRTKRPATTKKSSLRKGSEKSKRKRVSLVIDDQIVLPADVVADPPLTSPSDTAPSSASTSTTSLEEMIDPRLIANNDSPRHEYQEVLQESSPTSNSPSTMNQTSNNNMAGSSTTSTSTTTLTEEPAMIIYNNQPISPSPTSHSSIRSPLLYEPPTTTGRTFLEPSPPKAIAARNIPQHASSAPIYASLPDRGSATASNGDAEFSSYVGGISGSGVDDVNQMGSLGFPSSLGASYMESYMQSRPLSVRMAAAEKAGLSEGESAALFTARPRHDGVQEEEEEEEDVDMDMNRGEFSSGRGVERGDDDMDVIGNMEGF